VKKIFVLLLAVGLLAGCTKIDTSTTSSSGVSTSVTASGRQSFTIPHVLRYSTAEDITNLNPHLATQLVVSYMGSMTMAWLVKTDANSKIVPELAEEVPSIENGGISKDGKSITYHLRKDAKWSDGVAFDADDVVFSIKTVLNPATNEVGRNGWDLIGKIDEPDKYTVVLHLKKKFSPYGVTFFSSAGSNPCILPKHLLDKLSNINNADYNSLPVGIGPFKFVSWKRGDSVEMVANDLYFRGKPKLDKVIFKIIPDRNTVLTQLTTHEIDLWTPISAQYYSRVSSLPGIIAKRQPAFQFDHLDFNTSNPILRDARVRRALRYGVDRATIKDKIRHGLGTLSDNVFGTNNPAYHSIPLSPFSIAKGKALLDEAGWKVGSGGVRAKNGSKLNLVIATSSGTPDTDQQIELIRATWAQLGATITVRHYTSALLFAPKENGGILYNSRFDVIFAAWTLDNFGDLSSLYACDQFPPNGQNDPLWCNKRADAAMTAFKQEYVESKRNPYDYIVTDEIASDVPVIVMDIRDALFAYNGDLKNWNPNPIAPFDSMMDVDI